MLREKVRAMYVEWRYVKAGTRVGECRAYPFEYEPGELESRVNELADWEKEYANLGFRTVPLDAFINYKDRGEAYKANLRLRRAVGEKPILHCCSF